MTVAALLAACPPPGGGGTPPPPAATYTTTVKGTVVTPARAADPTKGGVITTAQVWASTDPTKKVSVDTTDGSYSLEVVKHSGTFTITADYTAGDGDYKAGAPQSVTTTAAAHTQNVALRYGYTITLSGIVVALSGSSGSARNGATVTAAVEGREVGSTTSSGTNAAGTPLGNYRITFDHPGTFRATASFTGLNDDVFNPARLTAATYINNFVLRP